MLNTLVLENKIYIRVVKGIKGIKEGNALIKELENAIQRPDIQDIIIDLSETFLVDSVFINSLVKFKNKYLNECSRISILSHNNHVEDLLRITKLDQIFRIRTDLAVDKIH